MNEKKSCWTDWLEFYADGKNEEFFLYEVERLREKNKRLREALKKIHHEVTNDIAGLPRDEALNIITWVAETADAALRQEV